MSEDFKKFNPTDFLDSKEQISDYLTDAQESNDETFRKTAIETAKLARARLAKSNIFPAQQDTPRLDQ